MNRRSLRPTRKETLHLHDSYFTVLDSLLHILQEPELISSEKYLIDSYMTKIGIFRLSMILSLAVSSMVVHYPSCSHLSHSSQAYMKIIPSQNPRPTSMKQHPPFTLCFL